MTWVMLIFFSMGQAVHSNSVEFKTEEQCELARFVLAEEVDAGTIPHVRTICIEKD